MSGLRQTVATTEPGTWLDADAGQTPKTELTGITGERPIANPQVRARVPGGTPTRPSSAVVHGREAVVADHADIRPDGPGDSSRDRGRQARCTAASDGYTVSGVGELDVLGPHS